MEVNPLIAKTSFDFETIKSHLFKPSLYEAGYTVEMSFTQGNRVMGKCDSHPCGP